MRPGVRSLLAPEDAKGCSFKRRVHRNLSDYALEWIISWISTPIPGERRIMAGACGADQSTPMSDTDTPGRLELPAFDGAIGRLRGLVAVWRPVWPH
jgi:hypothetical protein